MKQRDKIYGFVVHVLLSVVSVSMQQDPCKTARTFSDIRERLPSNKFTGQICLQDTYLDEGWYGEPGVEIPTDPPKYLHCGTVFPAYVYNMSALNIDGIEEAVIHVMFPSSSEALFTIQTKLCDAIYRVYNLKRIPSTCSSYCAAPAIITDDIPTYTAPVAVKVELTKHRLVFYCNFKQSKDVLWYAVTWYINDLPINTTEPVETSSDLINQTALHEQQIIDSGTDRVGFQVKCSFRASFTNESSPGFPSRSKDEFIGIKILTPTVYLNLNTDETTQIIVRPTAPIACPRPGDCKLHVNVVNLNTKSCKSQPKLTNCRMEVDTKNWTSRVTMNISAEETPLYENNVVTFRTIRLKTNGFWEHRIWGTATIGEIRVGITRNSTRIQGKSCSATTDPRIRTFSGRRYDHMVVGTFTLFRNRHLHQEVQIKTKKCGSGTCNCGVAIRAGRQVYEFNRCGGIRYWDIGFKLCDDVKGVFDVRASGYTYEITLSSKTKVNIYVRSSHLDVYIYPSNLDYGKSDGLCGTLKDTNGAFKHRYGTVQKFDMYRNRKIPTSKIWTFSISWRLPANEINLFDAEERKRLTRVSYPVYPCNCPDDAEEGASITCTDGEGEPVECYKVTSPGKLKTCKLGSKTKRHAIDQSTQNARKPHKHVYKREAPHGWINGWTEEKARTYCLQLFNRSKAVQLCRDVPNVDQTGPLENCISDIEFIGDTSFASDSVESIKDKCYHELNSNKTLQVSAPGTPDGTPSIFQQIQEVACPNECSDHGVCTNGHCGCEEDYGGIDCSVNIRDAPVLDHIFNDGYCTQHDDCQEISVYGETFLDTGNTHCKLRAEELLENGVIQDVGEYKHQAHVESISEAICTLPKSRKKKSTTTVPEESSVKIYHISVTNDGNAYSSESPVVVFNSVCQYCNIDGVKVECSIVDGYCVSGSRCYSSGETLLNNDCFICFVNGTSRAWIYSEADRCRDPTKVQSRPLWIIGVVLGGASLILLFGFGLIYKTKRKNIVTASTVDLKKENGYPAPPPYTKEAFVN